MEKIWRDIPGYEGLYQANNCGEIKSLRRDRILAARKHKGYLQLSLCKNGESKTYAVHRLVWIAFNGPIPEGYEVNHLNERPWDNRLENLNLMTRKENINWGSHNIKMGKAHRKKVEQYTLDGDHICTWCSAKMVEYILGYKSNNISACCYGVRKTAYGYVWRFQVA